MKWVWWGSLFMFVGVGAGAIGGHLLKNRLSTEMLSIFEVGVRYQIYHALALFAIGWLATARPHSLVTWAGCAFSTGIFLFSGSLYLLSLTGVRWFGAITPIGGLAFLAGWVQLLRASTRI